MPSSELTIAECSPKEVENQLQMSCPPLLLDVREAWEFDQGSLPGAHHVPLSNFATAFAALAPAPDTEIVTFCHHGVRSLRGASLLRQHGYARVASMAGGIDAWSTDVDPTLPRY